MKEKQVWYAVAILIGGLIIGGLIGSYCTKHHKKDWKSHSPAVVCNCNCGAAPKFMPFDGDGFKDGKMDKKEHNEKHKKMHKGHPMSGGFVENAPAPKPSAQPDMQ